MTGPGYHPAPRSENLPFSRPLDNASVPTALARLKELALLGTSVALIGGCGTFIGLGDFEIDKTLDEEDGGTDMGGASSGGSSSGGSASGGNSSGGETGSGGGGSDECDDDCDDGNECTTDACIMGECAHTTVDAGEECSGGVCNGTVGDSACVRCVDDSTGNSTDAGCTEGAPRCNDEGTPICTGCEAHSDCDDGNDCTADNCNGAGECVIVAETMGTACEGGVCNGLQGAEVCEACLDDQEGTVRDSGCSGAAPMCITAGMNRCVECLDDETGLNADTGCTGGQPLCDEGVCVECTSNGQCDDSVDCTVDSCNAGSCESAADNSLCAYDGDSGKCGVCDEETGCEEGDDPVLGSELLGNPSFDDGIAPWSEFSTGGYPVIWTYADINDPVAAISEHTPDYVVWLGGEDGEASAIAQGGIRAPDGTVAVQITTHMLMETDEDDDGDQAYLTLSTNNDARSEEVRRWLSDNTGWVQSVDEVDISDWPNRNLKIRIDGVVEPYGGAGTDLTSFFVDTMSVVPLVCE